VHWDLNLDEQGREAFDGIIANVAGGMRGEFNQRFGQNSKDRPQMMAHVFPSADVATTDRVTGQTAALHARIDARGSRLKVFYTNTSSEYHRGDASLVHTDPDGLRDVAHGPHTRVFHFTGTEHGLGLWPPTDSTPIAADPSGWVERSQNLRSIVNYGRLLRACLVNLDRWVTEGVEPPASRHPRVDDGTATPPDGLAKVFGRIPGASFPRHHARPRRLDFGADPELRVMSVIPPREGPAFGSLVSSVNEDGNEVAGITCPSCGCRWRRIPGGRCGIPISAAPNSCWCSPAGPSPSPARGASGRRPAILARLSRSVTPPVTSICRPCAARRPTWWPSTTCSRKTSSCR
jgi:hypothetical protein